MSIFDRILVVNPATSKSSVLKYLTADNHVSHAISIAVSGFFLRFDRELKPTRDFLLMREQISMDVS